MKTILIPVETRTREFIGKLHLATNLAMSGHKVIIGRKGEINSIALRSQSCVYFGHSYSNQYEGFYTKLKARGHIIAVQDEESLVTYVDEIFKELRFGLVTPSLVDLGFAWGKRDDQIIKSSGCLNTEITGSYRFDMVGFLDDFCVTRLAKFREQTVKEEGFALFVSSFGALNHFKFGDQYIKHLKDTNIVRTKTTADALQEFLEVKKESFKSSLEFLADYDQNLQQMVIRPHPSENPDCYQSIASQKPNISVTNDDNVLHWLERCDYFIHDYCTTAVEGNILRRPGYYFSRERCKAEIDDFFQCSQAVTSAPLHSGSPVKFFKDLDGFEDRLANLNSRDATNRIANGLESLAKKESPLYLI